jgi:hypothetical protein
MLFAVIDRGDQQFGDVHFVRSTLQPRCNISSSRSGIEVALNKSVAVSTSSPGRSNCSRSRPRTVIRFSDSVEKLDML